MASDVGLSHLGYDEFYKEKFAGSHTMTDIELLNATFTQQVDHALAHIHHQLQGYLWAEHHYDIIEVPLTWWDHLKQRLGFQQYKRRLIPQKKILLRPDIRETYAGPTLRKAKIVEHY